MHSLRQRISRLGIFCLPRRLPRMAAVAGSLALAASGYSCSLDPVHREGVNALGPEQPDLYPPESEYHRPGEPCALCHSKAGPASSEFALAGTVFWGPTNYERRVDKAYVRIKDAAKSQYCFVTNCNGNFYARKEDLKSLTFPLLVSVERTVDPGKNDTQTFAIRRMGGHIGREASCATCHIQNLADFGSPGQIRMFDSEEQVDANKVPLPSSCPNDDAPITCPEDK